MTTTTVPLPTTAHECGNCGWHTFDTPTPRHRLRFLLCFLHIWI